MINALVVGYGSIGRKHVANLLQLDGIDEVMVYTGLRTDLDTSSVGKATFLDASALSLEEVCYGRPIDFAIIANQTYKHIDTALILAGHGIHLFIEKPLSHNMKGVDRLEDTAREKRIKIFVAYNLRFLPVMRLIKERLGQQVIGRPYFSRIEVGQYLPHWRNNIHYRDSYSAKVACGGGVALDLSHEVDYMRYFFGGPSSWKTMKSKASELEIDAEDIFEGIYQYDNGFICHVHMDYLQKVAKRCIRIEGSKGTITCDLIGKRLHISTHDEEILLIDDNLFNVASTYREELIQFIRMMKTDGLPEISLDDGVKALQLLGDSHD
ncbi:MAG: Gfo/Idh/MocA family oxidoreductase [Syntrophales bacterium]|nr:Gfo/Idh/MocA family oxidoreductase [Syntrophales bacterium]